MFQLASQVENGEATTFTYDVRGNLTGVDHATRPDETFAWDANGNPAGAGSAVAADNRVTGDGTRTFEYDGEGNRTKATVIATGAYTVYAYDFRNRLTAVTLYSAAGVVQHQSSSTYDVFDRRIGQTSDGVAIWTVFDGENAWADYDLAGSVSARYLTGDRSDELFARWRPADGTSWYLQDRMFSVRDIASLNGIAVDHIEYDAFGQVLSETNPTAGDRFKYTGREYDPATGLYHYRARGYDPAGGRFLQQDPIGFAAGDTNLYRYVFNSPTQFRDPSGMTSLAEYGPLALAATSIFTKVCMNEATTRNVFILDFLDQGNGAEPTPGLSDPLSQWTGAPDLSPFSPGDFPLSGLNVPRWGQVRFCIESCADSAATAFTNGTFAVLSMFLELFNGVMKMDPRLIYSYAEPPPLGTLLQWKLRVQWDCGNQRYQSLSWRDYGGGFQKDYFTPGNTAEGGANAGAAESGQENGVFRRGFTGRTTVRPITTPGMAKPAGVSPKGNGVCSHSSTGAPNPGGRLGNNATRVKTNEVINDLKMRGYTDVNTEVRFRGSNHGTGKDRYADVVARNPVTGETEIIQIGQTLKSDHRIPVSRERVALDDIVFSPDIRNFPNAAIRFVDVNRPGVIQP